MKLTLGKILFFAGIIGMIIVAVIVVIVIAVLSSAKNRLRRRFDAETRSVR